MTAVQETPKHVAFLIDVNNEEFGCVRLNIVYHYIYVLTYTQRDGHYQSYVLLVFT
jgi:hypothetical protein